MKLRDNFYHIIDINKQEGVLRCKVAMNADHSIYSVHFPGNPVTPGVCLLQMATEILEYESGRHLKLEKAPNIRFRFPVGPSDEPIFEYTGITWTEDHIKVRLSVVNDTMQYLKMTLNYKVTK